MKTAVPLCLCVIACGNALREVEALPTVRCQGAVTIEEFARSLEVISERTAPQGVVYRQNPPRVMEGEFHEYAYQYSDDYFLIFGSVAEPGVFALSMFRYEGADLPTDDALLSRARSLLDGLDICDPILRTS